MSIAFVMAVATFAQSNTGSITGVVTDPNGAVVASATVVITNQGTNEKRTVTTDGTGRYDVPTLNTGIYTVEVTGTGFQTTSRKDLRLAVGERARLDITMLLSGVDAVVEVVSQTRTDTETSTIGDTIGIERITDNPVNGRDFTQLLATVPGSVQTTNQFQTSINGIPSTFGGTSVLVDGIDASRVDVNGTSNVLGRVESRINRVSMDSIQEVQVVESNYSAQYGQAMGAVINPITKSGGNRFAGSIFNYFRNEALDSDDAIGGLQRFRLNQFGGNLSGPIKKDKVFFFANYEGVQQTRGTTFNVLTFTPAYRATMSSATRPMVETLPLPQRPYMVNGSADPDLGWYTGQRIGELKENTGSVKIDWMQSDKSQVSFRYNINNSDTVTAYGVGSDQFADAKLRTQLFKFSHNYAFNATTANEFGFGINHNYTNVGAGSSAYPRMSYMFVNASINAPGPAQFNQERTGAVYHFLDTLTMVRGNHSIKAGADIRLNRRTAFVGAQDVFTFFGVNELALNQPFIMDRTGHPELEYANENFSFFVNDDWKAHPRLSLNLGLRYEVSTVSREKEGRLRNFDLATMSYTPNGEKIHNVDKNNFGPRVGFAFDVFGNQRSVLRGGYGIFYNRELPASFGSPAANSYPQISTDIITALFFCGVQASEWGYPVNPAAFVCATPNAMVIEKDIDTAMAQHWSLNFQQDLGIGTFSIGYVGNHVTHLLTDGVITPRNINRKSIVDGSTRPLSGAWGDIFVVGGYPQSNYHAMQASFKRNYANGFRFNANYTWSHAIDDAIGFFKDHQDPNNTRAERASSDQDVRHNFSFDAGYDLPFQKWFGGGPNWLVNGWQVNTITQIRSGFPVNVTETGGTFGGFARRPNVVQGVDPYCSNYSVPTCQYNAAAFSAPAAGQYGNAGRNLLRGTDFAQVDASFFKNTKLSERTSLQLRLEIFNLFNFANYADPSGGLSCGGSVGTCSEFGVSNSTVGNQLGGLLGFGGPRQIQLSARFNF